MFAFGWIVFLYNGHKDKSILIDISIGLIYVGWLMFLGSLFGKILFTNSKIHFVNHKLLWLKDKAVKLLIYITFPVGIIGTMEFTSRFGSKRVLRILQTQPTSYAIGVIVEIESRNTRGGPKRWAIIQYQTKTRKVIQAIYNYNEMYTVGQKYLLRYSINNPEMFEILGRQD